jgi:hypothetical protein
MGKCHADANHEAYQASNYDLNRDASSTWKVGRRFLNGVCHGGVCDEGVMRAGFFVGLLSLCVISFGRSSRRLDSTECEACGAR